MRIQQRLIQLHQQNPENSYLSPEKLFALVDLDLQSARLNSAFVSCMTTEDLYDKTYQTQIINTEAIEETRVIVTGWRHKEAYFLEPDLEEFFLRK